jgi:hypothetical protein
MPSKRSVVGCPSRRWRLGAAAAALLAVSVAMQVRLANADTLWTIGSSGTTAAFDSVTCAISTQCWAVSSAAGVFHSTDGGATWTRVSSTTGFTTIACPSTANCYAGGPINAVFASTDGGASWNASSYNFSCTGPPLACFDSAITSISCPLPTNCWAAAWGLGVVHTTDGVNWSYGGSPPIVLKKPAISCPSPVTCYVADHGISATMDGVSWSVVYPGAGAPIFAAISCALPSTCEAVGGSVIVSTQTGGQDWLASLSPVGGMLNGVSCPVVLQCWAAGASSGPSGGPVVLATGNAGTSWYAQAPGTAASLSAIACTTGATSPSCVAVGQGGAVIVGTGGPNTP